ncbi:MAG: hypothetical protein WAW36_12935 [Methylovulum miyakonense]|uniref:hypothetical protein n=1 Tax=Methylovulum miyakonense TaxID=645578 RepID=UPI003BB803E1
METLTSNITPQVINHYALLCQTIPLYPIENEHNYEVAIGVLNRLLDLGGADENHPLARLITALGVFIENYERHLPNH